MDMNLSHLPPPLTLHLPVSAEKMVPGVRAATQIKSLTKLAIRGEGQFRQAESLFTSCIKPLSPGKGFLHEWKSTQEPTL